MMPMNSCVGSVAAEAELLPLTFIASPAIDPSISDEPSVEFQSSDTAVHPVAYPNILKAGMQSPNSLYVLSVGYTSGSDIRYPKVCSFAKQI
ncbi:hypothetical protein KC19_10G094200 [Ceratodon purpureus]|uniref:Uncharacterized protein n=1 Tax=Ceratodon purpureus TaxID=3225 RepID=A0A8T0GJV3_CERPU|nr:hypothetical protein KC19_10G094200 [Ceratodon purpureus]